MKPIIEVNHVWKEYHKGIDRRYKSLRDTLVDIPGRLFGVEKEKFWALEDINFNVSAGESVGIIGRNGAGKSTLLKILSRITPPTKGEIILRGRVASLLEVGTGFHPELTGRENVFFNGSILGMRHQEIKRKFDEIVNFSGVEDFIDTPLKHYSSGMQMRLAFSVAAHLDSEILLIDEVLAVGDAEFQKKCIGKMDEVSNGEGKTILFVSHDYRHLETLCKKGLFIKASKNEDLVNIHTAIEKYISNNQTKIPKITDPYITDIILYNSKFDVLESIYSNEKIIVKIIFKNIKILKNIGLGIYFYKDSKLLFGTTTFNNTPIIYKGNNEALVYFNNLTFAPGNYKIAVALSDKGNKRLSYIDNYLKKKKKNRNIFNNPEGISNLLGDMYIYSKWEIHQ